MKEMDSSSLSDFHPWVFDDHSQFSAAYKEAKKKRNQILIITARNATLPLSRLSKLCLCDPPKVPRPG